MSIIGRHIYAKLYMQCSCFVSAPRKMNLDVSTLFRHNWSPTRDPIDVMKASLCYLGGAEVIITEIQGKIMEVIYWETN